MSNSRVALFFREFRKLRDTEILLYFLILPLIGILSFGLLYQRRVGREYPVLVLDLDHTFAARTAVFYVDSTPEMRVIGVVTDRAEAMESLRRGEVLAVLEIPARMLQTVKTRHPVQTAVWVDSRNMVAANSLFTGLQKALGYAVAGGKYTIMTRLMPSDEARQRMLPVRVVTRPIGNPSMDYALFVMSALLILLIQQCVLVGSSLGIAKETELGTLGETVSQAGGAHRYFFYRHLALLLGQLPVLLLLASAYFFLFDMPTRHLPLAVVLLILFSGSVIAFSQVLGTLFKRRLMVLQILVFFSLPAFFLSGYTWPLENMPGVLRVLSAALPSTPVLNSFTRLTCIDGSVPYLWSFFLHQAVLYLVYLLFSFKAIDFRNALEKKARYVKHRMLA